MTLVTDHIQLLNDRYEALKTLLCKALEDLQRETERAKFTILDDKKIPDSGLLGYLPQRVHYLENCLSEIRDIRDSLTLEIERMRP